MPVTAQSLSNPSSITFDTLYEYALDQMEDRTDEKAIRRAKRIVNRASKRVAGEMLWHWYRRRHRIILRPREKYTNISLSAEGIVATLDSGSWASDAATRTLLLSGDTELMNVRVRDSSSQITLWSTDIYVASANASGVTGYLYKNRYALPSNFRCISTEPHQKDYWGPETQITNEQMLRLNQTYQPSTGDMVVWTLHHNYETDLWEIMVWQFPDTLRSMDLYLFVWPPELVNDSDVLDWDPNHSEVIYAAIDELVVREMRDWKGLAAVQKAYRDSLLVAKSSDLKGVQPKTAGEPRRVATKMDPGRLWANET